LTRRERRLCRRLAAAHGLHGRGGPETSPAALFFRPSLFEGPAETAKVSRRRLDREELSALARKLFGAEPRAPAPPEPPREPVAAGLAGEIAAEELPRDW
jgi:hypothetical protein